MPRHRRDSETAQMLEAFRQSGLTRVGFCRRAGITVSTLDYHRRHQAAERPAGLVRVKVTPAGASKNESRFSLSPGNGRRIESDWNFEDKDLAQLIRLAESV